VYAGWDALEDLDRAIGNEGYKVNEHETKIPDINLRSEGSQSASFTSPVIHPSFDDCFFKHRSMCRRLMGRYGRLFLLLEIALLSCTCGYHAHSAVAKLPFGIESLGIPTFRNLTSQYKIEQQITSAVLKEFTLRTRATVNSSNTDVDSVLLGEIRSVSSVPVTFGTQTVGSQTFGSAFLVTVQLSVKLMRLSDSTILWQNSDFLYIERYVLNADVRDFFSEENPALERLAKNLAASLASTIFDRPTP
jgi:hypothetical protein